MLMVVVGMLDVVIVIAETISGQNPWAAFIGIQPSQGGRRWDDSGKFFARLKENALGNGRDEKRLFLIVDILRTSL